MSRRGKVVAGAVLSFLAVGVGAYGWHWYNTRIHWPLEIQRELLGREIAFHRSLNSYEGFSHWGQGAFTWSYNVTLPVEVAGALCGSQPLANCRFEKMGSPRTNVETSIVYDKGKLTIEEAWL